jgi:hypothetical protein
MQPGFQRELLERHGVGVLGKHVQQLHHAIDDLDGIFALGGRDGVDLLGGHGNARYEHGLRNSNVTRLVRFRLVKWSAVS